MISYKCPNCEWGKIKSNLYDSKGTFKCRSCKAVNYIEAFPALLSKVKKGERPGQVVSNESSCYTHQSNIAVSTCSHCGRYLCKLCDLELEGVHTCPECLEIQQNISKKDKIDFKSYEKLFPPFNSFSQNSIHADDKQFLIIADKKHRYSFEDIISIKYFYPVGGYNYLFLLIGVGFCLFFMSFVFRGAKSFFHVMMMFVFVVIIYVIYNGPVVYFIVKSKFSETTIKLGRKRHIERLLPKMRKYIERVQVKTEELAEAKVNNEAYEV